MIRDPKKYLAEQEQERKKFLVELTQEESVHLLEDLLSSGLIQEFTFSDHQPIALAMSIQNARKQV